MSSTPTFPTNPIELAQLFLRYPFRWLVPTVLVASAAVAYATLRPDTWEASQALVVRNEASGNLQDPGKFRHSDELKAVLETVLEISKTPQVLRISLEQVGPPGDRKAAGAYPSEQEVADFGDAVRLVAPKGAEYGKTEMFYLKVKDRDRRRAMQLAEALCQQFEHRYSQLRNERAGSMVQELTQAVRLAQLDVDEITGRLKSLEASVGGDLSELRRLHQGGGGSDSDLRRKSLDLENELRQAIQVEDSRAMLLKALHSTGDDLGQLRAIPNGLLEAQPTLRKLTEGLLDAQIRTSELLGTMSAEHPTVRAARISEQEISAQLRAERAKAIRGVEIDLQLAAKRVGSLKEQIVGVQQRLEKLAGLRAEYSNLVVESEKRTQLLTDLERKLVEAKAGEASTTITSLISRVDGPETGPKPMGPGRTTLLLAGIGAGFVAGAGVLLMTLPTAGSPAPDSAAADPRTTDGAPPSHNKKLSLNQALKRLVHPAA
jgi:uncharacterized protein involved in exopolysaccharide biosynthesis